MFHILRRCHQRKGAIATVEFKGGPYGAGWRRLLPLGVCDLPQGLLRS